MAKTFTHLGRTDASGSSSVLVNSFSGYKQVVLIANWKNSGDNNKTRIKFSGYTSGYFSTQRGSGAEREYSGQSSCYAVPSNTPTAASGYYSAIITASNYNQTTRQCSISIEAAHLGPYYQGGVLNVNQTTTINSFLFESGGSSWTHMYIDVYGVN